MNVQKGVLVNNRSLKWLRISIGIVYIWFGGLKFFQGYSPAEDLAIHTIDKLTFDLMPGNVTIVLLAAWEVAVGIFLVINKWMRATLLLLFAHMACTFTPLLFFPEISFKYAPYGFTLVGQYIMKNIIIVCAALVLWPQKAD